MAGVDYSSSRKVSGPLLGQILQQAPNYSMEVVYQPILLKRDVRADRRRLDIDAVSSMKESLPEDLRRSMDLASEKGASVWLTCLPIAEYGFCLHKRAFADALSLRYGWSLTNTPLNCACGAGFTICHALSCPKGGFPSIRHDEIRDLTAQLLSEVCSDVKVEPDLQPVPEGVSFTASANVSEGARLDVAMNGFWGGRFERSFVDVRVFNPHAPTNRLGSLPSMYLKHENEKKRLYEQRVREVEFASFTPLVLSATGGMAKQATIFYKRLASLLASKREFRYSQMMNWLRCRLSYSLLRSAIQCIRGARSSYHLPDCVAPVDLVISQSHLIN